MKIGFAGLGRMGAPMARHLLLAGHEVAVWNRSPEKAAALVSEGARLVASPADLAVGAEAVFTMMADDKATEEVVFGQQGIAHALAEGAAHICCATIGAECSRTLEQRHRERGQGYVACPVFGRPAAAEAKLLIIVAAGPTELIERFRPLMAAMGRAFYSVGEQPWQAHAVKLGGNFMMMGFVETFSEAVAMMRKAGVEPHAFHEVVNDLFQSPLYKNHGGLIVDQKFEPAGFALRLGLKDAGLILNLASETQTPLPVMSVFYNNLLSAMAAGQAEQDILSASRVVARSAGLE